MKQIRKRPLRGFTLIELAIVLGIIGTIISAIWYAAGNARESARENDALNEYRTVSQNVLAIMQGQSFQYGTWPTDITSTMITAQAVPASYVTPGIPTKANQPWSTSTATTSAFVVAAQSTKSFAVKFFSVTYKGCIALLTQGTACQLGQVGCPYQVQTANGGGTLTAAGIGGWTTSMTSTEANTLCALNDYSGATATNSAEFDFSL